LRDVAPVHYDGKPRAASLRDDGVERVRLEPWHEPEPRTGSAAVENGFDHVDSASRQLAHDGSPFIPGDHLPRPALYGGGVVFEQCPRGMPARSRDQRARGEDPRTSPSSFDRALELHDPRMEAPQVADACHALPQETRQEKIDCGVVRGAAGPLRKGED